MNFDNPTPLRVGATGTLNGWQVRVAGRIVMGMDYEGEEYTWNEFHLMDGSGNSATLVYEETEDGPEWKLFREFTPSQQLTAREAASKKVGDSVNLDGSPIPITLVDQSRVVFIEGRAPLGVDVGDVADYFNADTGDRMLVVSWTGDEIEFYEGLDIPAEGVAEAFGFPRGSSPAVANLSEAEAHPFDAKPARTSRLLTKIVLFVLGLAGLFSFRSCFFGSGSKGGSVRPAIKRAAPASVLANGSHGSLGRQAYVVAAQSVTDIARVSGRHERREYLLRGDSNETAVLVNGLSGGAKEWHLLRPAPVPAGLTPYDAAALRKGAPFTLSDRTVALTDLFLSKTLTLDALNGDAGTLRPGAVEYGFVATAASNQGVTLARWDEQRIELLSGPAVPEAEVLAAFGRAPATSK